MSQQVHPKENIYLIVKVIATVMFYAGIVVLVRSIEPKKLAAFAPLTFYVVIFLLYIFLRHGLLIGYLKGNAVRVTENQFPEVYRIATTQSEKLGMRKAPAIYVVQSGGLLNAFATRFFGNDFVVIYSDVLATAYEGGNKALEFIIGHELGHILRKHSTKNSLLFPSFIVPFLNQAYSRACEYTCDRIGYSLCPEGSVPGMLILAAGKHLHSKVNIDEFLRSSQEERGFWKWFAEVFSSHPNLPKRISLFMAFSGHDILDPQQPGYSRS